MENNLLSVYLAAPFAAWLVAQLLKVAIAAASGSRRSDLSLFFKSGSMPSSHSAMMIALLVAIGARDGIDTALFGVVAVLSVIVMYDAVNVRRAVGEQGIVLRKLVASAAQKPAFYMAKGHLISEVVAGALVGSAVSVLMLQFL
ncbi:MAG: divergent PAP2 family protein [Candidatus Saccharimonadales bacterium]